MKVKNIIKKQNKLFQLKLIKTKIYKKKDLFSIANLKIRDIEYRLKKGLQIIYLYHLYNKKILFIGNSSIINIKLKDLLKNMKHTFIADYLWLNGIITNKQQWSINSIKKNDLIVILTKKISNNLLKESFKDKIPIIFLESNPNIFNNKISYKIPGNFLETKTNFFLFLVKVAWKKSKLTKKKQYKQFLMWMYQKLLMYKKRQLRRYRQNNNTKFKTIYFLKQNGSRK